MSWFFENKAERNYVSKHQVKSCDSCEYSCGICLGNSITYGMDIKETSKMFPQGCENWKISFKHYCDMMDLYARDLGYIDK